MRELADRRGSPARVGAAARSGRGFMAMTEEGATAKVVAHHPVVRLPSWFECQDGICRNAPSGLARPCCRRSRRSTRSATPIALRRKCALPDLRATGFGRGRRPFAQRGAPAGHGAARFVAARCAALAAAAPGDDADRAHTRRLALAWLQAELARWTAQRSDPAQVDEVERRMRAAAHDDAFGGVRGERLADLDAAERDAWQVVWRALDDARRRGDG